MQFCHWSHSASAENTIVTPGDNKAYLAVFAQADEACPALDLEELYLPIITP
ncbi:hypothetical protein HC891_19480 [Candidatus Gracilibacteria bacterium]|nr:hypothetical protein [Candidatus Gracilibacteria bacterium]